MESAILSLFDLKKPIHIVFQRETWPGADIHKVKDLLEEMEVDVRYVVPASLSIDNEDRLYAIDEHGLRSEVLQVSLEVEQAELRCLPQEVLQALAVRCRSNDVRTIFLVHDKRFLAVLLEQLESQVDRGILSPRQAKLLQDVIIESHLPSSSEAARVLDECERIPSAKDAYVLKAIRSGRNQGHTFGFAVDQNEWLDKLRLMVKANEKMASQVLQRFVKQRRYPIIRHHIDPTQTADFSLVSSYCACNGRFLDMGPTRIRSGHLSEGKGSVFLDSVTDVT